MITFKKFEDHASANAQVMEDSNGSKALISYKTTVAVCDENAWLRIFGLFSATTRKHIGWFMKSLGLDYYTAKNLFVNNMMMNIYTGEVVDI